MDLEYLTTNRLLLRQLTPQVYHHVYENYTDPAIKDFFGFSSDEDLDKEREKYKKGMTTFNKSFLYFQLLDKTSEKVIGWCGFHTWYLDHKRAEIGYGLTDDDFKGKGIMTEAIIPVIEYGFVNMNLHRIEAFIGPENVPSLRLIRKLHFKQEGILKEHYFKNGNVEDSVVFALLKSDYLHP